MKVQEWVEKLKYEVESEETYMGISFAVAKQALAIIESQRAALAEIIDKANEHREFDRDAIYAMHAIARRKLDKEV